MRMKPSKQKWKRGRGARGGCAHERLSPKEIVAQALPSPLLSSCWGQQCDSFSNSCCCFSPLSLYISSSLSLLSLSLPLLPLLRLLLSAFLQFRLIALKWVSLFGLSLFDSLSPPLCLSLSLSRSLSLCRSAKLCWETKLSRRRQH